MAAGGPGGGILFGLTVVRNAVSTVVVRPNLYSHTADPGK
jgi:hypothetical protein